MTTNAVSHIEPHAMQLTAWDMPTAVVAGQRFKFALGVRCAEGCNLGGRDFSLIDQQGAVVDTLKLGREIWPGTEALYVAEVEVEAPRETGHHHWQATIAGVGMQLPHAAAAVPLSVSVVGAPDCEVTIRAVDREQQTPIRNALVVMHPYRTVTDDDGIAKIRAARGQYDILVSGFRYLAASTSVEVKDDLVTVAELDVDQPWTSQEEDLA